MKVAATIKGVKYLIFKYLIYSFFWPFFAVSISAFSTGTCKKQHAKSKFASTVANKGHQ